MIRTIASYGVLAVCVLAGSASAIDDSHRVKGEQVAAKAIAFLKAQQDAETGGWSVPPKGKGMPALPAISGLVLNGMLMQPGVKATDPEIEKGLGFILSFAKPNGAICDAILPSYNTAICASALAKVKEPSAEMKTKINAALEYLRKTQWGTPGATEADMQGKQITLTEVDQNHPFYGGLGYGNRGRPDISNLQFMLQAFADCGVPKDDPAVQRAIVFLQRCQMIEKGADGKTINDQGYAKGSRQGGFIYATAENPETIGKGQSFAGSFEETLDDGTKVSRLRAYGSVTYAGFKSYIYAGLTKDDPRVKAAMGWIGSNYTLAENPGIGKEGFYYYLVSFSRALDATGSATIETTGGAGGGGGGGAGGEKRDWQNDLIDRLAELQTADGSFAKQHERWMEDNPVLVTAYGLVALQHALRD